jgi:hypothetical protein
VTGLEGRPSRARASGQAMAEFAIVFAVFMLVVGAIIQFGVIVWSINAVTQISRDTARWAVTQSASPCDTAANRTAVATAAKAAVGRIGLAGYNPALWATASPVDSVAAQGVGVDWPIPTGGPSLFDTDCPPSNNSVVWFVNVRINHVVPIFLPGLQLLAPSCGSTGFCISSTTSLRMEPKAP